MPAPGPFRPQLDAAIAQLGLLVDRDTVLRARAAVLAESYRLDEVIRQNWWGWQGVGRCGDDPVSADAAPAFTERVVALLDQCRAYNADLREAAYALDETARRYGYTDDEIAASFQAPL